MSTTHQNLTSLKRHSKYYYLGGDLIVITGDYAFRLPSIFFTRESKVFRDRLAETKGNDADNGKSRTDSVATDIPKIHTIVIAPQENVSAEDFAKLCWVFLNPQLSVYDETLDGWKTILRLANQWNFTEVKELVFRELETPGKFVMPLVERIVLYQQYNAAQEYLEPLYLELLSRPEQLTLEEGEALQMKTTLLVSGARERLRTTKDQLASPLPSNMRNTILNMVKSIFHGLSLSSSSSSSRTATSDPQGPNPTGALINFGTEKPVSQVASTSIPSKNSWATNVFGSNVLKPTTSSLATTTKLDSNGVNGSAAGDDNRDSSPLKNMTKKEMKKMKKGANLYGHDDWYDNNDEETGEAA